LPQVQNPFTGGIGALPVDVALHLFHVFALDLQRTGLTAVGQTYLATSGHVVADLADRPDGVFQRVIAHDHTGLDHLQYQMGGSELEQRGGLAHVGITDDHVQSTETFGVGVGFVAGVDDGTRASGGRGDTFPYVFGTLADTEQSTTRGLEHLSRTTDDLPGDEEGDEDICQSAEFTVPTHQVVLVAAVGVTGRVGVVLEQVDVSGDALLVQALLGVDLQPFQDAFARLVMGHQVLETVALGGGVLGVAAHVQIQASTVAQEHVAAAPPGDHSAEEVPCDLVGRQAALSPEGTGDPVLVLQPEDPSFHVVPPTSRHRVGRRDAVPPFPVGAMPRGRRTVVIAYRSFIGPVLTGRSTVGGAAALSLALLQEADEAPTLDTSELAVTAGPLQNGDLEVGCLQLTLFTVFMGKGTSGGVERRTERCVRHEPVLELFGDVLGGATDRHKALFVDDGAVEGDAVDLVVVRGVTDLGDDDLDLPRLEALTEDRAQCLGIDVGQLTTADVLAVVLIATHVGKAHTHQSQVLELGVAPDGDE